MVEIAFAFLEIRARVGGLVEKQILFVCALGFTDFSRACPYRKMRYSVQTGGSHVTVHDLYIQSDFSVFDSNGKRLHFQISRRSIRF